MKIQRLRVHGKELRVPEYIEKWALIDVLGGIAGIAGGWAP